MFILYVIQGNNDQMFYRVFFLTSSIGKEMTE